jgi:hypothetical protein
MVAKEDVGVKDLHKLIVDSIVRHSNLTERELESLDIEEMEKRLKIRAAPPRTYFHWEIGEKTGWQIRPYKFVSVEELNKRERRLETVLGKI